MFAVKCSLFALFVCASGALGACGVDKTPLHIANPDAAHFATQAYPVLLRDCGFPACHGAPDRFFSMYGPGRSRLSAASESGDPATDEEIKHSYDRARSMIDVSDPARSLLLRKPMATRAGGAGHKGTDSLGRNVYETPADPRFQVLRAWVLGQVPASDAGVGP